MSQRQEEKRSLWGGGVSACLLLATWSINREFPDMVFPSPWTLPILIGSSTGLVVFASLWVRSHFAGRSSSGERVPDTPLGYVFRHLGHGSKWSVRKYILAWAEWHKDAEIEIRKHLDSGNLRAWGIWDPEHRQREQGHRLIEPSEWAHIRLEPRLMTERGKTWNFADKLDANQQRCGRYLYIYVDQKRVDEIWPKWSWIDHFHDVVRLFGKPTFAERTGELRRWREGNAYLPRDHDYYWLECKRPL